MEKENIITEKDIESLPSYGSIQKEKLLNNKWGAELI